MKTICITGGTSGVGYALASHIAKKDTNVILVGRNAKKGAEAVDALLAREIQSTYYQADLTDIDSVKSLVARIKDSVDHLDVLSYNAGTFSLKRMTVSSILPDTPTERTFAVNFLGFYALTELLLPLLLRAPSSRIVSVSGGPGVLQRVSLDFENIDLKTGYSGPKAAIRAALAKVLYTTELANRLRNTNVTPVTFHPGIVHSSLGRELPLLLKLPFSIANVFFPRRTRTGSHVLESNKIEDHSGAFYARSRPVVFATKHTIEDCERLSDISTERTGIERFRAP